MGNTLAMPECNLPERMLIGVSNAKSVLRTCSKHKLYYAIGFMIVITMFLCYGYAITRNAPDGEFQIPFWLIGLPAFFIALYSLQLNKSNNLSSENLEYTLSGMSKKEYLNYKIGDDRAYRGFMSAASSSAMLSGSTLLGPFIRADARS